MKGWSPFTKKPKTREGSVYVGDKQFSDKPMYEGHEPSTHLMADDDKLTACLLYTSALPTTPYV